jgi:hypothetical protein
LDFYRFQRADGTPYENPDEARAMAIRDFEMWLGVSPLGEAMAARAKAELRGKDLACWCRLDQPCHADVLIELANASPETTGREE